MRPLTLPKLMVSCAAAVPDSSAAHAATHAAARTFPQISMMRTPLKHDWIGGRRSRREDLPQRRRTHAGWPDVTVAGDQARGGGLSGGRGSGRGGLEHGAGAVDSVTAHTNGAMDSGSESVPRTGSTA